MTNYPTFLLLSFFLTSTLMSCSEASREIVLSQGLHISSSATIKADTFFLPALDSLSTPVITISGSDLEVDFNGAVLLGATPSQLPNTFAGLGILVKEGKNIRIKNLNVRGYKVGLMAVSTDSLQIEDSDFSYNYRQRLKSTRKKEDLADWMSYHNNEQDQWLRYGAAVYMKGCNQALVRNLRVTGGQNGLMLVRCNKGLFYNNDLRYNSGLGIGMYRSSRNRVMHNRLDFNIRGYSHGIYNRGQDSAGLLAYEQCRRNIFAFNSATHSGDGFFLWAGHETMESGKGGCNSNVFYANDCSYASNNGIEITFSGQNKVVSNRIDECDYALWGGYSYQTSFIGNRMKDNRIGVAFEQGNNNELSYNHFEGGTIGIQLWEREKQPADWKFAQKRDVSSRQYRIANNYLDGVAVPFRISHTKQSDVILNYVNHFTTLFEVASANQKLRFLENRIYQAEGWGVATEALEDNTLLLDKSPPPYKLPEMVEMPHRIRPLADGMYAMIADDERRGRQYMLIDEWGPYDFQSPFIWLEKVEGEVHHFVVYGPADGKWKLVGSEGLTKLSVQSGQFPMSLTARREVEQPTLELRIQYIGPAFIDRFGRWIPKGQAFEFAFREVDD